MDLAGDGSLLLTGQWDNSLCERGSQQEERGRDVLAQSTKARSGPGFGGPRSLGILLGAAESWTRWLFTQFWACHLPHWFLFPP